MSPANCLQGYWRQANPYGDGRHKLNQLGMVFLVAVARNQETAQGKQ